MKTITHKDSPLILVADDDRFTRMILRQILEQDGYQVTEVENGEQCLNAYSQERPDMVLLDGIMPVMDGFDCCIQLQMLPWGDRTPVLMITGLDDQQSVDRAFEAGATDFVTKPIHPPLLRRRLRRLLEASWNQESLRKSEEKYRSVVDNLKEVIFQTDTARRLTFLNPAWTEITGLSLYESLGKRFLELIHPDDRHFHDEQFQRLIECKQKECRYQIRYLIKNGGVAHIEVYACLMLGDDNTVIGISGTLNDITERKRREQLLSAEQATARILAESATLRKATPKILQVICENLGWDVGELWKVDAKANMLRCVETWHVPSIEVSKFEALTEQIAFSAEVGLPERIWTSAEPLWIVDIVKNRSFLHASRAAKAGLHTAFGFPILNKDEKLGVMTFFSREIQKPAPDLIKMMAAITSQMGQFIKRKQAEEKVQHQNRILQAELNQAAEYVRSLLPLPLTGTITTEAQFIPSTQLGGDAFDYYWLDADHFVVYLLDVAGHGVRSALLSVSVLNVLRSQSLPKTNFYQPSSVLAALNQIFQMSENGDDYFTIWYGVYNRVKRQLVYACAGHPPAFLVSNASTATSIKSLGSPSSPIGVLPEIEFDQNSYEIQPHSTLYIFSDGVYEIHQPDGSLWGLNAFINFLTDFKKSHTSNLETIFHHIKSLNANKPLDDDFSLLKINIP
jgi:sigma-B regulation protein RsbU (phosphoserine phosphatase)